MKKITMTVYGNHTFEGTQGFFFHILIIFKSQRFV